MNISEIEGIGPEYAAKLAEAGIHTTETLLERGATPRGRTGIEAATGISGKLILEWVNLADLMRIDGVGSEYADLLEAAGVDSPAELAHRNAANLAATFQEIDAARPDWIRRLPSEATVAGWIDQAKAMDRGVSHGGDLPAPSPAPAPAAAGPAAPSPASAPAPAPGPAPAPAARTGRDEGRSRAGEARVHRDLGPDQADVRGRLTVLTGGITAVAGRATPSGGAGCGDAGGPTRRRTPPTWRGRRPATRARRRRCSRDRDAVGGRPQAGEVADTAARRPSGRGGSPRAPTGFAEPGDVPRRAVGRDRLEVAVPGEDGARRRLVAPAGEPRETRPPRRPRARGGPATLSGATPHFARTPASS